jgi:hypothetical protein
LIHTFITSPPPLPSHSSIRERDEVNHNYILMGDKFIWCLRYGAMGVSKFT